MTVLQDFDISFWLCFGWSLLCQNELESRTEHFRQSARQEEDMGVVIMATNLLTTMYVSPCIYATGVLFFLETGILQAPKVLTYSIV
jgi:hypothetical protein